MSRDHDKIRMLVRSIILEDAQSGRAPNIYVTSKGKEFAVPTFKDDNTSPGVNMFSDLPDTSTSTSSSGGNKFNNPPAPLYISSRFNDPRAEGNIHTAVDYTGPGIADKPVLAALGGTVVTADPATTTGYGHQVKIDHSNGLETRYAHLNQVTVTSGSYVNSGQKIGTVGNTGHVIARPGSTGHHLHFGLYRAGVAVDPLIAPELNNAVFPVDMK